MLDNKFTVLVCGGRDYDNGDFFFAAMNALAQPLDIRQVVAGGAKGADSLAELWAREYNYPFLSCPADWNLHGRSAGPIRNRQMAKYVSESPFHKLALAFGGGRGTDDMCAVSIANKINVIRHV